MSKTAKAAVGLMVATLLAKFLGFGRELALASAYGASKYSDAFLVSQNIPTAIFSVVGTSLGTAFIPLYSQARKDRGEEGALSFTNNVLLIVAFICFMFSIIGSFFAENLVKLFAVGFEAETFNLAVHYTRITLLGLTILGANYMMSAYLQVKENFVVPGLMSVPYNIILIIFIFVSAAIDPNLLAWGALLGLCSQIVLQIPFAVKNGFRFRFSLNLKDEYLKKMLFLILPVLIGVAVNQVNAIVDKSLASTLIEGSISALNYGNRLVQFVLGLFIVSISTVIYPLLSKLSSEKNTEKFNETITTAINTVMLLVIPVSAGAITLATPVVKLLFQRGAFDETATQMTSVALICYSIGIIGFGLRDILGKVFYSLQDTKTPMRNGVICMVLNIILNLSLVKYLGHGGLALATSTSSILCIILLLVSLYKKIGDFGVKEVISTFFKVLILSIIMAVSVKFVYSILNTNLPTSTIGNAISLIISVFVGIIIYAAGVLLLKIKEVRILLDKAKGKFIK